MKSKKKWKVVLVMTAVLLSLGGTQVFATIAPSVSQKAAPEVVGTGTYTDANGNAVTLNGASITIVPDSKNATLSAEAKAVYDQAKAALIDPNSQYNKDLAQFLKDNYAGVPAENVVVRDIFDISVNPPLTFDNGQKLELTLKGSYKQGDTVIVTIFNKETGKWDFIATSDVKVNADGTLTVKFPHLCPVAVLVQDTTATTATTTVDSTKKNAAPPASTGVEGGNGNQTSILIPILLGAGAVIVVVSTVILKKKKSV